jgi:hypothetical protein
LSPQPATGGRSDAHTVCRVNVVYVISAYRLPEQLVRLVSRLRTENATVLVHIDKKASPEVFGAISEGVRSLPDVHLLDRHVCHWGGFGHVAASLGALAAIVENGIPCDQAVLLTGQDFPLKSNEEIKARLDRDREYSFLCTSRFRTTTNGYPTAGWTVSIAGISGFGDEDCRCRANTDGEGLARPSG